MSEFINLLTRKNSLRKNVSTLSISELEKVLDSLASIVRDRQEEEAKKEAEQKEKELKIAEIIKVMRDSGITLNQVQDLAATVTSKSKSVTTKYEILVNGEKITWSGRGRTPVAFANYMKENGIIKDQLPTIE